MDYLIAASLEEAISLAEAAEGRAKYLAGGTDLVVQIAEGAADPSLLIDISGIEALRGIESTASGLRIGAAVTIAELLEVSEGNGFALSAGRASAHPAIGPAVELPRCLLQGAGSIGSPQIRRLATIGGNVGNASPCGDTLAPLIVLGAEFILRSGAGSRRLGAEQFFLGPKSTVLEPAEILESILIPASHLTGKSAFRMIGKRNGQVISQVNIAVWLQLEGGGEAGSGAAIREIRIAAGSVAPVPLRLRRGEELLRGAVPSEALLQAARGAVQEEIRPISDVRTTEAYRRSVTASLFVDAMTEVLES